MRWDSIREIEHESGKKFLVVRLHSVLYNMIMRICTIRLMTYAYEIRRLLIFALFMFFAYIAFTKNKFKSSVKNPIHRSIFVIVFMQYLLRKLLEPVFTEIIEKGSIARLGKLEFRRRDLVISEEARMRALKTKLSKKSRKNLFSLLYNKYVIDVFYKGNYMCSVTMAKEAMFSKSSLENKFYKKIDNYVHKH